MKRMVKVGPELWVVRREVTSIMGGVKVADKMGVSIGMRHSAWIQTNNEAVTARSVRNKIVDSYLQDAALVLMSILLAWLAFDYLR